MKRLAIILLLCFITTIAIVAQELKCTVTINSDQVQGTNK